MTLVEHLYELRHRLAVALLAVAVGAIGGFLWFQYTLGPIPSLGHLLTEPYCSLPASTRLAVADHSCALLQTQPFEAFMIQLQVGIAVGAVLASPIWLYQLWAFITPALRAKERKFALAFVGCAVVLFVAGAVLAYLVVPEALKVLTHFGGGQFVTALAGNDYVSFVLLLLVIFGVSFELPLLVVMLNLAGVLKYEKLAHWRRGIIFILFVFAAFATPGGDPVSMLALACTLTVLFEIAVQIARVHDKRVAARRVEEGWDGLADDEPTPLDHHPEPIEPATLTESMGPTTATGSSESAADRFGDAT
ncbi:MAG: twin-arginine translocase subunit TatC [Sciscionella sp.]|nr:twin-arginine translocase subunit TatC [Sciscionella sp.]